MPALALTWADGRDPECWHEKDGGPPSQFTQECLKWGAGIPDLFRTGSYTDESSFTNHMVRKIDIAVGNIHLCFELQDSAVDQPGTVVALAVNL